MALDFIIFVVPAVLWFLLAKIWFHHKFQWQETVIQIVGAAIIVGAALLINRQFAFYDTQLVHGNVTELVADKRSCDQYWSDWQDSFCTEQITRTVFSHQTCTTNDKGKQTCVNHYKTQYYSIYPWEIKYYVKSDVGVWYISRVDRQGAVQPPRWLEAKVGDPVTSTISVENYIKASADTIMKRSKTDEDFRQDYPVVYDYYKSCNVFWIGIEAENGWCEAISKLNSDLKAHKVNIILTITNKTPDYAETLAREWHSHKINDLVVTLGVDEDHKIVWADVRSWSSSATVNLWISGNLARRQLDQDYVIETIRESVTDFYKPRDMSEFEYLKDDLSLSTTAIVVILVLLGGFTIGSSILFHKEDFF